MSVHGPAPEARATAQSGPLTMPADEAFALAVRHFQAGDLVQAETVLRAIDAAVPGHPDVLCNLGVIACAVNKPEEAIPLVERALAAAPDHRLAKATRVNAYLMRASGLARQADVAGALAVARRLIAEDPGDPKARVDVTGYLHAANARAELSDFAPGLDAGELGQHLFVACMPKSGSTFLTNALVALTQYANTFLTYAFLHNEQELYLPNLVRQARDNTVTQQHCRATAANVQLMNGFGIRPVVLVRDVHDVVLSLRDFYDKGAVRESLHADPWAALDPDEKADFVIDAMLPWYLQFYVSWVRAAEDGRIEVHWQTYEDMIADKPAALAGIAAFYGLGKTADEIAAAVANVEGAKARTRFNKGVPGRGAAELTPAQKDRIARLAGYYRGVDLSPIGL